MTLPPIAAVRARIEPWLQPISADAPCGAAVTYDSEYEAILAELAKLDSPTSPPVRWRSVGESSLELLGAQSKDLWLGCSLTLALFATESWGGLFTGLVFLRELCGRFWPDLHPALARPRRRGAAFEMFAGQLARMVAVARARATEVPEGVSAALAGLAEDLRGHSSETVRFEWTGDSLERALCEPAPVSIEEVQPEGLDRLAQDEDWNVRRAVACDPEAPGPLLAALASDPVETVRLRVASNPSTPPDALAVLAMAPEAAVRAAVARNPETPLAVLESLGRDRDPDVRHELALCPRAPAESLHALAHDEVTEVRATVAAHPTTKSATLEALARDSSVLVRAQVAAHARTPAEVLGRLARDEALEVRVSLAGNPAIPAAVLEQLASDPSPDLRWHLSQRRGEQD